MPNYQKNSEGLTPASLLFLWFSYSWKCCQVAVCSPQVHFTLHFAGSRVLQMPGFAMRRRGCLNPLCTFPGGHWIRANIKCGHREVGCLFKQEPSEGARWLLWKRGRNPTTRHRNIDTNIYTEPSHNSIALIGGPPRPYRPISRAYFTFFQCCWRAQVETCALQQHWKRVK